MDSDKLKTFVKDKLQEGFFNNKVNGHNFYKDLELPTNNKFLSDILYYAIILVVETSSCRDISSYKYDFLNTLEYKDIGFDKGRISHWNLLTIMKEIVKNN